MSADEYYEPGSEGYANAEAVWLRARDKQVGFAQDLLELNVHKQTANRLLEPFMWHTVIATGTFETWQGFFDLRISDAAQPEIRIAAEAIRDAVAGSTTRLLDWGDWHLPLVDIDPDPDADIDDWVAISASRCARVSYDRHNDDEPIGKSLERARMLARNKHLSPFEHVARPSTDREAWANLHGWKQLRYDVERGLALFQLVDAATV